MTFMNYDIVLTYTSSNQEIKRISGHLFEVLDYYLLLRDNGMRVKIIIPDDLTKEEVLSAWGQHYELGTQEIDFQISPNPKLILAKKILNVTGFDSRDGCKYVGRLFQFRCGHFEPNYLQHKLVTVLQDDRVYKTKEPYNGKSINYVKKINVKYFKPFKTSKNCNNVLYLNTKLRKISLDFLIELKIRYHNLIIISEEETQEMKDLKLLVLKPPVDILDNIGTGSYIYTRTTGQFDCSSRLVFECKYRGIKVNFELEEDFKNYCQQDTGLFYRVQDLENIENLYLTNEDEILKILK